jgi:membrane-bound lytic murein transglycosylase D
MWQFMRSTGKMYMRVDYSIDERLDPVRSTIAAAKLLRHNYQSLKSWPLAITAYNHGVNGMRRAVEATGSTDIEVILRKHESQSFKFASKNFYACFLAASQTADSAHILFPGLKKQLAPALKSIVLEKSTTPATLARRLGLSEEALKQHNPSLRPVVFSQQKALPAGFTVNFPAAHTPPVQIAASATTTPKNSVPEPPAELTQYYKIVRGDNLQAISRKLGVSLAQLMQLNDIKRSDRIYAGQVLRLPSKAAQPEAVAQRTTKPPAKPAPAVLLKPAVVATPVAPVVAKAALPEDDEGEEETEEADGQEERDASVKQPLVPHANDTLPAMEPLVFIDTKPSQPPQTGPSTTKRYNTTFNAEIYTLGIELLAGGGLAKITVALNETIGHYAEWMKVATRSIRRLNNVTSNNIRIGSTLQLPIGSSSDMRGFEVNRLEYHMAIEEDFYARFEIIATVLHTIRPGETIWGLCKREQLPMWLVKKHNPDKDIFALKQGAVLSIPKITARTAHTPPPLIDSQTDSLPIPSTDDNSQ